MIKTGERWCVDQLPCYSASTEIDIMRFLLPYKRVLPYGNAGILLYEI